MGHRLGQVMSRCVATLVEGWMWVLEASILQTEHAVRVFAFCSSGHEDGGAIPRMADLDLFGRSSDGCLLWGGRKTGFDHEGRVLTAPESAVAYGMCGVKGVALFRHC